MARRDPQSTHYHDWHNRGQNWRIDQFCRGLRIQRAKLEQHPYFSDVATMLMFDSWQQYMSSLDRDIWQHCWQSLYHKEIPLSGYHRRKLTSILDHIELRQIRQDSIQKRLAKKAIRASEIGKRSHDNDSKGLRQPDLVTQIW